MKNVCKFYKNSSKRKADLATEAAFQFAVNKAADAALRLLEIELYGSVQEGISIILD